MRTAGGQTIWVPPREVSTDWNRVVLIREIARGPTVHSICGTGGGILWLSAVSSQLPRHRRFPTLGPQGPTPVLDAAAAMAEFPSSVPRHRCRRGQARAAALSSPQGCALRQRGLSAMRPAPELLEFTTTCNTAAGPARKSNPPAAPACIQGQCCLPRAPTRCALLRPVCRPSCRLGCGVGKGNARARSRRRASAWQ